MGFIDFLLDGLIPLFDMFVNNILFIPTENSLSVAAIALNIFLNIIVLLPGFGA